MRPTMPSSEVLLHLLVEYVRGHGSLVSFRMASPFDKTIGKKMETIHRNLIAVVYLKLYQNL